MRGRIMADEEANTPEAQPVDDDEPGLVEKTVTDVKESSRRRKVEVLTAAVLALAAIGTAWVSYESSRFGTVQTSNFNMSNASRVESTKASSAAGQLAQVDIALFVEVVNAFAADDTRRFDFYVSRARDEFKPALDAWLASDPQNNPDAAPTPFEVPEYQSAQADTAIELEAAAEVNTLLAAQANQRSDNYVLAAVVFAAILFLAGISSRFKSEKLQYAFMSVAIVGFIANSVWVATFPVVLRL